MTPSPIRKVLIVGGGTAGWMTAAALSKVLNTKGVEVTLVESDAIATVGVGEATIPPITTFNQILGIDEAEFMRATKGSFKLAIEFIDWKHKGHRYQHPFGNFGLDIEALKFHQFWLRSLHEGWSRDIDDYNLPATAVNLGRFALPSKDPGQVMSALKYAFHFDAGLYAKYLRGYAEKRGVTRVEGKVGSVQQNGETGFVTGVTLEDGRVLEADLFVDCTGFRSLLLGEALGVPFKDCGDVLFCDTALAVQIPYAHEDSPIASHTISTAQSAGWIWDIGLPTRRGTGHVFSSNHISDDEAERDLRAYLGPAGKDLAVRKIKIRSGHRETFWKRNCVAVGLAAGFLEPLEASAIVLIELSAKLIAEQMPRCREVMDVVASRFNATTHYRWGRIIDFLKLHYVLTKRTDSAFWRDNVRPETIPERLQELMLLWKYQSPWFHDEFDRVEEVFPPASYQYVLYGMGFRTEVEPEALAGDMRLAERAIRENATQTERLRAGLPRHRDLIRKIQEHGLQPV